MKLTPMMQQYMEVKERYPDTILFYRMGDFYEMFFEDAIVVSRELGLTLTARNKGGDDEVPMAGMPHHSSKAYIRDLIDKGFTVAICEQIEDPASAKGIVKRDVVRVITPGVVFDTDNLDAKTPNYCAAIYHADSVMGQLFGIAYADISTGEFRATEVPNFGALIGELHRIEAREILLSDGDDDLCERLKSQLPEAFLRTKDDAYFSHEKLIKTVTDGVRLSDDLATDGYYLSAPEIPSLFQHLRHTQFSDRDVIEKACTAVLHYLIETQRGIPSHIQAINPYQSHAYLIVDEATKANLELTQTLMGGRKKGSLLSVIDKTITAIGGRRLRHWLTYPLLHPDAINKRLDAVEEFFQSGALRHDIRLAFDDVYDIERLCGKITSGSANARDLQSLSKTLGQIPAIKQHLESCQSELIESLNQLLDPCQELCQEIHDAIVDNPPTSITEGGLFKKGYHDELDELMTLSGNGKDWMLRYEEQEKKRTGISSLKVKYNKVFGYYIEVTRANLDAVPDDYIRKQTLTNAERFFTPELKETEERILGADERLRQLEHQLFEDLRQYVAQHLHILLQTSQSLADLDVIASLAELARRHEYCRPTVDMGTQLVIKDGRHPVVERSLVDERFIPNSIALDTDTARLIIITGPNMAGKSTVIRQVALITLMAQMGSFVPAKGAHIGVRDKIFSRVGASDNLARGHSTFMVEMTEAAHILNNATDRSLIILDEIGRGTSTYDGLSIAWSVAEHLHDNIRAQTLFATHYHELTQLVESLAAATNMSIAVKEWKDDIIFLRKLVQGQANRSYGIQVGKLAGLPEPVIERAKSVLESLEKANATRPSNGSNGPSGATQQPIITHQMSLFHTPNHAIAPQNKEVLDLLGKVNVNTLTPLEALNILNQLVEKLEIS